MIYRKQINKEVRKRMSEEFNGFQRQDVTANDIDMFMISINNYLQNIAHEIVDETGFMPHLDRKAIKDATRLFILQDLAKYFPSQVVEYLWKIWKNKLELELTKEDFNQDALESKEVRE